MAHPFNAESTIETKTGTYKYARLGALTDAGIGHINKLPYSIRVLLESCLRNVDGEVVLEDHVKALANYNAKDVGEQEIAFNPGRVVLQDFTGVPAVVDLAALRSAMERMGGDTSKINPLSHVDLVIDHSVQIDSYGSSDSMGKNVKREFERNHERYKFLKWGQQSFENFTVVPPAVGIVHQVNLEYLAGVTLETDGWMYPDSLVGTDSHTTMINGLGIVGWGVGGIEAEAAMLGQPIYMLIPEVVGFNLKGKLQEGMTATDLVLTVTQMLRELGVVGKFVEFYGDGLDNLSLADRATLANMAPEYGATMGFFPVDQKTLDYLELTGRDMDHIEAVKTYCQANGFWRTNNPDVVYSDTMELDMGTVQPSLSGPKRPQDKILLGDMKSAFAVALKETFGKDAAHPGVPTTHKGQDFNLDDGDVVIASITSCTNTSNPSVMIAAGLLAKAANEKGMKVKPWVKTSLAPGSRVVTDYLNTANLTDDLEALGFYTVGYGCTTCIGNSGPLDAPIVASINEGDLVACSVLSGNRNFEGRIGPDIKANYLASPPLVVAYAIAGSVNVDFYKDPLGQDKDGNDVYLKDLWPTDAAIAEVLAVAVKREDFVKQYAIASDGSQEWQDIDSKKTGVYGWEDDSTYIQEPPFFQNMGKKADPITPIKSAKLLGWYGDSTTTDHISPAGAIPNDSPTADYLRARGVERRDFNSYGSRRGNDQIMTRGTFGNIRIKNKLADGKEGGYTKYLGPDEAAPGNVELHYASDKDPRQGEITSVFDASVKYQKHGIPLLVIAGKDYGMGSSRDWAAKGTFLLGVKTVIAESYERIHRSNLIGMGVLPLEFKKGDTPSSLGLDGTESFDVAVDDNVKALGTVDVKATKSDGSVVDFTTNVRLDTPVEIDYYRNGGILHMVLRRIANEVN